MAYPRFDRTLLKLRPLSEREHLLHLSNWLDLDAPVPQFEDPSLPAIAQAVLAARRNQRPVVLMAGAHLIRAGVSRHIIRLLERDLITHVALNGAGAIHDFELAMIGATTESVSDYITTGEFGLWQETGRLNEIVSQAAREDLGYGEAVGRAIDGPGFPYQDLSIFRTGYRLRIPVTVHVGIGYDIVHEHPSCDGAAVGQASYNDFLTFAHAIQDLEGGVVLAFGSAVMAPEVYLKALAMARNVAAQQGQSVSRFTTAVFDLAPIQLEAGEPDRTDFRYYYRPLKTMLLRTVKDGGSSYYVRGDHRVTMLNLYRLMTTEASRPDSW